MQPIAGNESIFADATDDLPIVENRASSGFFDGLSQADSPIFTIFSIFDVFCMFLANILDLSRHLLTKPCSDTADFPYDLKN